MNWKLLSLAVLGLGLTACDGKKEEKKETVETKPLANGGVIEQTTVEKKPVDVEKVEEHKNVESVPAEPVHSDETKTDTVEIKKK